MVTVLNKAGEKQFAFHQLRNYKNDIYFFSSALYKEVFGAIAENAIYCIANWQVISSEIQNKCLPVKITLIASYLNVK